MDKHLQRHQAILIVLCRSRDESDLMSYAHHRLTVITVITCPSAPVTTFTPFELTYDVSPGLFPGWLAHSGRYPPRLTMAHLAPASGRQRDRCKCGRLS